MELVFFCMGCLLSSGADFPTLADNETSLKAVSEYFNDDALVVKQREFVRGLRPVYSIHLISIAQTYGWRDAGGVVHFPDGSQCEGAGFKKVDFDAYCKKLLHPTKEMIERNKDSFYRMRLTADPGRIEPTPALTAIWLYRLNKRKLALEMWLHVMKSAELKKSKDKRSSFLALMGGYAPWVLFNNGVSAHMYDKGEVALDYMQRFKHRYPDLMRSYGDGERLLSDLIRRKKEGRLELVSAAHLPKKFASWSDARKTSYLIGELDQVNARQWGQPGGVMLSKDWRVAELIRLGEVAVSPLIDCLEKDERLTKSVHYWRDFYPRRTVLSVREAALNALMSILQVRLFDPASTGDSFTSRQNKQLKMMVGKLRAYWEKNKHLPQHRRVMNLLMDKNASLDARMDAMRFLAWYDYGFHPATTVFSDGVTRGKRMKVHPLISEFSAPTLAEAVMDMMHHDEVKVGDSKWKFILKALAKIGDKRIGKRLAREYEKNKNTTQKLWLAITASKCGSRKLLDSWLSDVRAGKLKYGASDLPQIINLLTWARDESADAFLFTLADKQGKYYKDILKGALYDKNPFVEDDFDADDIDWDISPLTWKVLINELGNTTLTNNWRQLVSDTKEESGGDDLGGTTSSVFGKLWIAKQKHTKQKVFLRVCDLAAERLSDILANSPLYSPLLLEKEKSLAAFREKTAAHPIREIPHEYVVHLSGEDERMFCLSLPVVMNRLATQQDVDAGRAIFCLPKGAKKVALKLPSYGYEIPKEEDSMDMKTPIVILQAEKSADGKVYYGCLTSWGTKKFAVEDVNILLNK